jgi:hypothetical protein
MAQRESGSPARTTSAIRGWIRSHLALVVGAAAVVVLAVVVLIVVGLSGSGGGGPTVAPGSIVGSGALTSGYRVTGKVIKVSAASLTVQITSLNFSAGEARNVVFLPGAEIDFERPADGTVVLARNGHLISTTTAIRRGDTAVIVGQFTSVIVPPGPVHQGYAYFGVEATSK